MPPETIIKHSLADISTITLKRGEGLITSCEKTHEVYSFEQASSVLREMARRDPPHFSDKVDFTVIWNNKDQYNGTYLLRKHGDDPRQFSLQNHMREHLKTLLSDTYRAYLKKGDVVYFKELLERI